MTCTSRGSATTQLVIGLAIMCAGVLLVLDQAGLFRARDVLQYWPVVLILIGALRVGQSRDRSGVMAGAMWILFGSWFLLTTLHVLPSRSWRYFWPGLLVMAGAALVFQTFRRATDGDRGDSSQTVSIFALLGGGNRKSTANPFRGGDLFALMGGGEIDLRQATIPSGQSATLEIFSMMGGFEIRVPETWAIDDRTMPVMGGVGNETRPSASAPTATLVLRGFLMMGGVTIRN